MAGVNEATAKTITGVVEQPAPDPVELLADLKPLVELVATTANHLHIVGGGFGAPVVMGFDMATIDTVARWIGLKIDRDVMADLRVIENEMVKLMNERRDNQ